MSAQLKLPAVFKYAGDCPVCGATGQKICRPVEGTKRQVWVMGWRRYLSHDERLIAPGRFVKRWEVT